MRQEKITAITVGYGTGENHTNNSRVWDERKSQQQSGMGREKITAITVGYGTGENHSNNSQVWDGRKSQQ